VVKFPRPKTSAQQAAEKVDEAANSSPQALKRDTFPMAYGTTKVVPFPRICVGLSSSAACEVVPFPKPA